MKINLRKEYFTVKERLFLSEDGINVYLFQFDTGVHAVKLENRSGHVVVLPFKGQQI